MKYAVVLVALGLMAAPWARAEFNPPVAVKTVPPVPTRVGIPIKFLLEG